MSPNCVEFVQKIAMICDEQIDSFKAQWQRMRVLIKETLNEKAADIKKKRTGSPFKF